MISVVVCTVNRARQLKECLSHLHNAHNPGVITELIVVDNNSSDKTKEVVAGFRDSSFSEIKYLFEERQGLSHARNKGIAEAKYPLLAFIDDDCYVGKDWLGTIFREFFSDPFLDILGGRVELAQKSDQPVGIRTFSDRAQISSFWELHLRMIGCNFVCTRKAIEKVGQFDPLLGKGSKSGSAEDTDFFYRALKKELKIMYSPELTVFHAHGRSTLISTQSVRDDYSRGRGAFYCKYLLKGDLHIFKTAMRELRTHFRNIFLQTAPSCSMYPSTSSLRQLALGGFQRLFNR